MQIRIVRVSQVDCQSQFSAVTVHAMHNGKYMHRDGARMQAAIALSRIVPSPLSQSHPSLPSQPGVSLAAGMNDRLAT